MILDDAFHYLSEKKLDGVHSTVALSDKRIESSSTTSDDDSSDASLRSNNTVSSTGETTNPSRRLLIFSAADKLGPKRQAQALQNHLQSTRFETEPDYLDRLCHTLNHRRTFLPWRTFAIAESLQDAASDLHTLISEPIRASTKVEVIFVFTGQGAQWPGMGCDLLCYKAFRQSLEAAARHLQSLGCSWSLLGKIAGVTHFVVAQLFQMKFSRTGTSEYMPQNTHNLLQRPYRSPWLTFSALGT